VFKKIQLNRAVKRVHHGKGYEVFVNGTFYRFKNKRDTLDFSRRVDGWLNDQFEQTNGALIQVYGIYRKLNAYMEPMQRNVVRGDINEIEKSIDLTFDRSSWDSWTVTTFSKLETCLIKLDHSVKIMALIARDKSYTITKSELRVAAKLVEMLREDFKEFEIQSRKYETTQNESKIIFFNPKQNTQ
jgi:hypothetical protein